MAIGIHSETAPLQKVLVHTPGREVSLVNPKLKDELLFDDIIFEEDARREHLNMLSIFEAAMPADGEILEILDLVRETFRQEEARLHLIDRLVRSMPDSNIHLIRNDLEQCSPEELVSFIIEGTPESTRGGFVLWPLPNLLFTRDLAAIVGRDVIISRAAKQARARESILMETLVEFHPEFKSVRTNALYLDGYQTIEGGDILVINENTLLIGMSERTSFTGIFSIAERILDGNIEYVIAVDIPKKRSYMHLDTIFTMLDHNEFVVFPPAIEQQTDNVIILSRAEDGTRADMMPSLKQALEAVTGETISFISCGGSNPVDQYREQWTDGANILALAPGIVVVYDRNTHTLEGLMEYGYRLMEQFEFIETFRDRKPDPERDGKIVVTFHAPELCRGRGGARCMTLPLLRQKL